MSEPKVFADTKWSVIHDMTNKLVINELYIIKDYRVDTKHCDPDGVPLVFFATDRVTRVRKMTEKEFKELVKKHGHTYEINMVYAPEMKLKKEEGIKKDDNNKKVTRHST